LASDPCIDDPFVPEQLQSPKIDATRPLPITTAEPERLSTTILRPGNSVSVADAVRTTETLGPPGAYGTAGLLGLKSSLSDCASRPMVGDFTAYSPKTGVSGEYHRR
jgi:hypothetical protein